ncbi:MAG TPA: protein-export chaperone SecB [Rhizomicrobium sp.]|jgi:preprotein translocase subunit SecB|nr:protein-export chaperone SecB [Rhizomicrobium sp.]
MSGGGTSGPNGGEHTGQDGPRLQVLAQYIKDLSFENPGMPSNLPSRPQIDLNVDLQARQLEAQHYEVELKLRVSAAADSKAIFLLELVYGGLFQTLNMPEEMRQPALLIDAPHILFPFARRIVADVVRDGGMPPLLVEPIDFAALYRARIEGMQQMRQGAASV